MNKYSFFKKIKKALLVIFITFFAFTLQSALMIENKQLNQQQNPLEFTLAQTEKEKDESNTDRGKTPEVIVNYVKVKPYNLSRAKVEWSIQEPAEGIEITFIKCLDKQSGKLLLSTYSDKLNDFGFINNLVPGQKIIFDFVVEYNYNTIEQDPTIVPIEFEMPNNAIESSEIIGWDGSVMTIKVNQTFVYNSGEWGIDLVIYYTEDGIEKHEEVQMDRETAWGGDDYFLIELEDNISPGKEYKDLWIKYSFEEDKGLNPGGTNPEEWTIIEYEGNSILGDTGIILNGDGKIHITGDGTSDWTNGWSEKKSPFYWLLITLSIMFIIIIISIIGLRVALGLSENNSVYKRSPESKYLKNRRIENDKKTK